MSDYLLYGHPFSANTYRAKLFLSILGEHWDDRLVDLRSGEQRSSELTALNGFQQVPILASGEHTIIESHAILIFLAEQADLSTREQWWPADSAQRAMVARWLFFSAGDLHFGVGLARNERAFGIPSGGSDAARRAKQGLERLDAHLSGRNWLALDRPTLADVSVYPFIAVLSEAGLDDVAPNVTRWVENVRGMSGFIEMPRLKDFLPPKDPE